MDGLAILQELDSRADGHKPLSHEDKVFFGLLGAGVFVLMFVTIFLAVCCGVILGRRKQLRNREARRRDLEQLHARQRGEGEGLPHEERDGDIELAHIRYRMTASGHRIPELQAQDQGQDQAQDQAQVQEDSAPTQAGGSDPRDEITASQVENAGLPEEATGSHGDVSGQSHEETAAH